MFSASLEQRNEPKLHWTHCTQNTFVWVRTLYPKSSLWWQPDQESVVHFQYEYQSNKSQNVWLPLRSPTWAVFRTDPLRDSCSRKHFKITGCRDWAGRRVHMQVQLTNIHKHQKSDIRLHQKHPYPPCRKLSIMLENAINLAPSSASLCCQMSCASKGDRWGFHAVYTHTGMYP